VNADIILATHGALRVLAIADETLGPFEVDVFNCLAQFLRHDVCKGRGRGGDV